MPPRKNMSVAKNNRKESSVEFDATYFKIHDDALHLIECYFGASKEDRIRHKRYIYMMAEKILDDVFEMGKHIRIANAIYPKSEIELYERRKHMECAIGLCFDILTKYQLTMYRLRVRDNKYLNEIKNLQPEINCLKKWRASDNKRFG